jgi:EmrB/QacA subfamily drug resistance transporter
MVILDSQIVILALPAIEHSIGFTAVNAQWVMSAYLLSFGGPLMLGGRVADLVGRRRMFMSGSGLFLVASLWCGLARSAPMLIAARVAEGLSAAIMLPSAHSIVLSTFDEGAERNKALGILSSVSGIGALVGLVVGGPLTDKLGWPWIFFLNIPVAAALFLLSPLLLRESREAQQSHAFDFIGAFTLTGALVLLVYGIVGAPHAGWFGTQTISSVIASVAVLALFVLVESRSEAPLVPIEIFLSRSMIGSLLVVVLAMLTFGMTIVVSFYLQEVLGFSASQFGIGAAILPLTAVAGSMAGQYGATRIGVRPIAVCAMALLGIACMLLSRVAVNGTYFKDVFGALAIFGFGVGAADVAAAIATFTGVPSDRYGLASGINSAAFQIGGALGTAVVTTVAISHTGALRGERLAALTGGFTAAFRASSTLAVVGVVIALFLMSSPSRRSTFAIDASDKPEETPTLFRDKCKNPMWCDEDGPEPR